VYEHSLSLSLSLSLAHTEQQLTWLACVGTDLLRYFSYEMGVKCDEEQARINARFKCGVLQNKVDDFIDMYVLCPVCHLPETDMQVQSIKARATIVLACAACGARSSVCDRAAAHRLAKFIIANQLDNSAYQNEIAHDEMGDKIFALASELSIAGMTHKLSDSLVLLHRKRKAEAGDANSADSKSDIYDNDDDDGDDDDNDNHDNNSNDDDDGDWACGTDEASLESRQQQHITGRLKGLASNLGDDDDDDADGMNCSAGRSGGSC
jgi:hypothetical protein